MSNSCTAGFALRQGSMTSGWEFYMRTLQKKITMVQPIGRELTSVNMRASEKLVSSSLIPGLKNLVLLWFSVQGLQALPKSKDK